LVFTLSRSSVNVKYRKKMILLRSTLPKCHCAAKSLFASQQRRTKGS